MYQNSLELIQSSINAKYMKFMAKLMCSNEELGITEESEEIEEDEDKIEFTNSLNLVC